MAANQLIELQPETRQGLKMINTLNDTLKRFQRATRSELFYEVAETVLDEVQDLELLVQCAELANQRQPGGAFYRALFWVKVDELLSSNGIGEGEQRKTFNHLCKQINLHPRKARNLVEQGQTIRAIEPEIDIQLLRPASSKLFHYAQKQGERAGEYLSRAVSVLEEIPTASHTKIHQVWCRSNGSRKANLDIIKPSDWWAFSHPKWRKEDNFSGSIPGEVYANALYYFAPETGVAVDAMAGSGMFKRVYDDRERWQKDLDFDLAIHLFDINPCRNFIQQHDARRPLPVRADWIFIDPPYYGHRLYDDDLSQAPNYEDYLSIMREVVKALVLSLNPGGRLCVFLPKWSGTQADDPNHDVPGDVAALVKTEGLKWIDMAYVSRGRQQEPGSATKNKAAKRDRRMRSDTCILNVFEKPK